MSSWFFLPRPASIAFLELIPIVVAADIWGSQWCRLRVQFRCDNQAVLYIINSGTSKAPDVMHLLRHLSLTACRHHLVFSAIHTPGIRNTAADALSHLQVPEFRRLVPFANPDPLSIPASLLRQLLRPD